MDSKLRSHTSNFSDFDLEQFIIYRCVVGSRAYGLDNDESDTDRRGIYLAPAELQWSLFGAPEQFEDNATQSCYWELQKFLTMALKANPNILECLYSPMVEKVTPLGEELLALRQQFLSPDDFPDLQRLRHVAVQEDRAGHPQPRRSALETRHAPAAPAAHRRGHVARRDPVSTVLRKQPRVMPRCRWACPLGNMGMILTRRSKAEATLENDRPFPDRRSFLSPQGNGQKGRLAR